MASNNIPGRDLDWQKQLALIDQLNADMARTRENFGRGYFRTWLIAIAAVAVLMGIGGAIGALLTGAFIGQ